MNQENIAQNAQQKFEENISSMIENDGELSMEELDSVAGGSMHCVSSSKKWENPWRPCRLTTKTLSSYIPNNANDLV
jgi:hypothetical protein